MIPVQWLVTGQKDGRTLRLERPDSTTAWDLLWTLHALGWSVSMRRIGANAFQVSR
jgi:hypothetical protein